MANYFNGWVIDGMNICPVEAFINKVDWLEYMLKIFPSPILSNFCHDYHTEEEINLIVEAAKISLNEKAGLFELPRELFEWRK